MVVGRAVRVAVFGALIGFAIAIAAGPTVAPLLFQTSAREPLAFIVAVAIRSFRRCRPVGRLSRMRCAPVLVRAGPRDHGRARCC